MSALWEPVADTTLTAADVDDTPVNGAIDVPISSNWAFDHAATALAHSITGAAEIGADLADGDELPVYDLSATANKKSLVSRIWTYISSKLSSYTGALTGSSLTVSGSDEPTYGAELLTSAGWTVGAGWAEAPDDTFTHTGSGGIESLTHSATIANATKYQLTYTITGRNAGTVTITFGGQTTGAVSASGTFGPTTSSTAAFTITPTTDFNGTLSLVSLKAITAVSTPRIVIKNSGGTVVLEERGNSSSTFIGTEAGRYNTTGNYNCFLGVSAGQANSTGSNNSFLGYQAGYSNTTAGGSCFVGYRAGYANTTSNFNTFLGYNAGSTNSTGYYNCFVGASAGQSNTTGRGNTLLGYNAGLTNSTGADNTFLGEYAGRYNTTGNYNCFVGVSAGQANSTGNYNCFLGVSAGQVHTTGNYNCFVGASVGQANTTGNYNCFLGVSAGRFHADGATALTDPEGCVYIGYAARGKNNDDSNSVVIGGNAPIGLGANTTVIGTSDTTLTRLYGDIATGVDAPSAAVHAIKTTEQLRLGYDASNYLAATVSSTGNLTLDTTGGTIYTPDTIENTVNGGGIILKSPDGTRYRITVANGGALSVSAA